MSDRKRNAPGTMGKPGAIEDGVVRDGSASKTHSELTRALISEAELTARYGVTVTATGLALVFSRKLTIPELELLGPTIWQSKEERVWWLGDLWCHDEFHYGERKAMAIAKGIPYAFGTLIKYGYVARHVAPLLRSKVLKWSHHYEVAQLEPDKQKYWLDLAVREKLSVRELRLKIAEDDHDRAMASIHSDDEHRLWKNERSLRTYLQRLENAGRIDPKLILEPPDFELYLECHVSAFDRFVRTVEKAADFWNARLKRARRIEAKLNSAQDETQEAA